MLDLTSLWQLVDLDRPDLKVKPLSPVDPASAPAARRGRADGRVRGDPGGRHPRPPPVRELRRERRAPGRAGCRRSRRPHDQADALPHVARLGGRQRPRQGRRAGQAGRRARRGQGPLRRAGEHRLGSQARASRGARRVRARRAEDALQDAADRAPRGFDAASVRPHRHGQLQQQDRAELRRSRPVHVSRRHRLGRHGPVQHPHRPVEAADVPTDRRRADGPARAVPRAGRARDRARDGGPARPGSSSR